VYGWGWSPGRCSYIQIYTIRHVKSRTTHRYRYIYRHRYRQATRNAFQLLVFKLQCQCLCVCMCPAVPVWVSLWVSKTYGLPFNLIKSTHAHKEIRGQWGAFRLRCRRLWFDWFLKNKSPTNAPINNFAAQLSSADNAKLSIPKKSEKYSYCFITRIYKCPT